MKYKLSTYTVVTQTLVKKPMGTHRVVHSNRSGETRLISESLWQIVTKGMVEELQPEFRDDLIQSRILVPTNEDELMTVLAENDDASENNNELYIVVQPTADCQLGCSYCGQEHSKKLLSQLDQELLVRRILGKIESGKFQRLTIGWFGGEPISGITVIRSLTPQFRKMAEKHGCRYSAKMVTNGLALTHKIATELVNEHDIQFIEITLDGTSDFHNARRMQKSGKSTFDMIFSNLSSLAKREDLNVKVSVRCNVDRHNFESVSPLIQLLADEGLQDRLIRFYAAPIHSWGNDAHTQSLSPEEFSAYEIKWLAEQIQLGFKPALVPNRKPIVCIAVQPQSDLIDAYGNIFNCSEVSYVPAYGSPNEYAVGHLSEWEEVERRQRLGDFNKKIRDGIYSCGSCRMLPVCGGACPKSWSEGLIPCPSAKYNIEQRLILSYATLPFNPN